MPPPRPCPVNIPCSSKWFPESVDLRRTSRQTPPSPMNPKNGHFIHFSKANQGWGQMRSENGSETTVRWNISDTVHPNKFTMMATLGDDGSRVGSWVCKEEKTGGRWLERKDPSAVPYLWAHGVAAVLDNLPNALPHVFQVPEETYASTMSTSATASSSSPFYIFLPVPLCLRPVQFGCQLRPLEDRYG